MKDGQGKEVAPSGAPARAFHRRHLLGFLPTVGMLGGIVFANRVRPLVFGLPFLVFWIAAWVVATSFIMWVILKLDRAHERAQAVRAVDAPERVP